jgi:hypothetical protein
MNCRFLSLLHPSYTGPQGHARTWIVHVAVHTAYWSFVAFVGVVQWVGWPIVQVTIRILSWPLKDWLFFCCRKLCIAVETVQRIGKDLWELPL